MEATRSRVDLSFCLLPPFDPARLLNNTRPVCDRAAGFIGAAFLPRLLQRGDVVIGIDNLNSGYDLALKQARLEDRGYGPHGSLAF